MTYKSLYRTYRPHSFETVVGQKHIIQTLQNALKTNKMSHAYLFCGPRGTGKTTVAKLVAKSVNCLNPEKAPCNECEHCRTIQNGTHPDVIEIDAASNNGVDEIRDLIEKVKYAPIQAKYKVYIIDEVHMLSQGAFNALLKTLEEPPSHVIFILATTEPHKVLPTIISRCQRYDFVRVNRKDIQMRIEEVLKAEKIEYELEAIRLISQLADGGVRDALSILEQCIAYSGNNLLAEHVNDIYGIATTQDKLKLLHAIITVDVALLMQEIEIITRKNIDIRRLTNDLMELLKESVVFSFTQDEKLITKLNVEEAKQLNVIPNDVALNMIEDLMDTSEKYRSASNLLSYFEIGLLKLLSRIGEPKPQNSLNEIKVDRKVEKVEKLERVEVVENKTPMLEPEIVTISKEETIPNEPVIELDNNEPSTDELMFESVDVEDLKTKPKKKQKSLLKTETLDRKTILQLLASGDKTKRLDVVSKWDKIQTYLTDLKFGRVAQILINAGPVALNDGFMVLSHNDKMYVNELNSEDNQELLESFTELVFGLSMRAFAIEAQEVGEITTEFKRLLLENNLPEPVVFEKKKKKVVKQTESIEKGLFELFGEENVEII
jgi:DNA polymerase-3 subunit gamma/tau